MFKVGDRVVCVKPDLSKVRCGLTGTVVGDANEDILCGILVNTLVKVEWDVYVGGHSCLGFAKPGFGWNVFPDSIEHIGVEIAEVDTESIKDLIFGGG